MTPFIEALRRRDSAAWDIFYREHLRDIYGFLFRLVRGDRPAAEDLFQETWLQAIDAIEQYEPERGELRGWLFGIARRRVALYWRRTLGRQSATLDESFQHAAADGALLPDDALQELERAEAVQAALLVLSDDRRRVLTDKYVEDLSVEEIAKRHGKTPKSVESLLSRARDELRSLLRWQFSDLRGERK